MLAQTAASSTLQCRKPTADDGSALHSLIQLCPPLDNNSRYCNLLQCTHFSHTSAVADLEGELVGAVTGFIDPAKRDTWFIWQVAVREDARGAGLTQRLIDEVLSRSDNAEIHYIETSITEANASSWGVFKKLAGLLDAPLERKELFDRDRHFKGQQASEILVRIGPFATRKQINNR